MAWENIPETFSEYACKYLKINCLDVKLQSSTNFAPDIFWWSAETLLILISIGVIGYFTYKGYIFLYTKSITTFTSINDLFQRIEELDRKAKILREQLENMNLPPLTQYYADGNYVDLQIIITQILEQQKLHEQLMRDILVLLSS